MAGKVRPEVKTSHGNGGTVGDGSGDHGQAAWSQNLFIFANILVK